MGYLDPLFSEPGTELGIDVIGKRSTAWVRSEPMFDAAHDRPRVDSHSL